MPNNVTVFVSHVKHFKRHAETKTGCFKYENLINYMKYFVWTQGDTLRGKREGTEKESLCWVEDETQHWGWEGIKKGKGRWVGSSGAECCRKEKGGRERKGGPGTQRQRNTHSCRVSTPISLYCSSCFTWASSCFSLESCGHKAEHRVTVAHNGLLSPPPPAKTA